MSETRADIPFRRPALRSLLTLGQRTDETELLDATGVEATELAANLRDLARLGRLPGGDRTSISGIERLLDRAESASVLDVGTGAGGLAAALVARASRRGQAREVIALDRRPDVLHHAARRLRGRPSVSVALGDARSLPLDDGSVDVAHSSLLLHHLDPSDAVTALREMRRVARCGVVVNDLRRGLLAYALGAPTVLALGRSPMTRHDGLVSLRRAYTLAELDGMLDEAGLRVVWRSNRWAPRVVTAAVTRAGR